MSGALPTTPKPASIEIRSVQPTRVSVAHSLKRQVRSTGAQRWGVRLSYPPMRRSAFMPLWGFLMGQDGQYETFTLTPAGLLVPLGSWGGAPAVNGALSVGAVTGAVDGMSNSITGAGKAGDFFKFSGHSKVYQLRADLDTNGSGEGTIYFRPALVAAVANNETITSASVPFTVALTQDQNAFRLEPGAIVPAFELDCVEVY